MKTLLHLAAVLAATATLTAQSENNASETFRYTGTVVDAAGQPVDQATVSVYRYGSREGWGSSGFELQQSASSRVDGGFELQLDRSTTVLVVHKAGLAPTWRQFTPTRHTEERLTLPAPTELAGTVVDDAGQPVVDAEVFVSVAYSETTREEGGRAYHYLSGKPARDLFSTRTSTDGRFRLTGFPTNSSADLAVRKPGKVLREARREYLSPETMQCRAGQRDIRLVLDAGSTIAGKVAVQGSGEPLGGARLLAESDQPGVSRTSEPATSEADGAFCISEIPGGSYRVRAAFGTNAIPDWVADSVSVSVAAGETNRDVQITATRGGFLAVIVVANNDGKPLAQANIHAFRTEYRAGAATDTNGHALLRLPPGEYRVSAFKEKWRVEDTQMVTVEAGQTNRITIKMNPPLLVSGRVRDPQGKPVADLPLTAFPSYRANIGDIKTDAEGQFQFKWDPRYYARADERVCLLARDLKRNLAAARELDEETAVLDLRLEPGLVIAGRVETIEGKPITDAAVTVYLWSGNSGSSLDKPVKTDAQGRFEVAALPPERRYSAHVTAKGFGSGQSQMEEGETETNRIELPPFVLTVADRRLAGQVVDEDDKPVANAYVHIYGEGQPNESVRTDADGHFQFEAVCEGSARLSASAQSAYGNTTAEAGDTNVVITLGARASVSRATPKRASLVGKPLPDLTALNPGTNAPPVGQPLLICVFDFEQRPSRHCVRLLAGKHQALREKGLAVLAVQVPLAEAESLQEWQKADPLPFSVACVGKKSDQNRWATSLETLPWLILSDGQGRVSAEGFTIDELAAKMEPLFK